jgi:hypothetical protein
MEHELIKTTLIITNVIFNRLKWRARHHTPALAVAVTDSIKEDVVALEHLPGPIPPIELPTSLTTEICVIFDNFGIYHWDDFIDKSKCFDYNDFVTARETEGNIGADIGIVPTLTDNIPMRDFSDNNIIWIEVVKILRSKMFDRDLQIKGPMSTTGPLANMYRFLQNLEHCSGENAEK